jgi:alpha-tubulin suppressor-like RCC1 family protein
VTASEVIVTRMPVGCCRRLGRRSLTITALALAACAGDSTPPPPPSPAAVASVELQPQSPTLGWRSQISLTAVPKDAAGNVLTGRVATWSSSDPTRIQVTPHQSPGGALSAEAVAVGVGEVTVTATVEGKIGETKVTATLPPGIEFVVWPDTSRIPVSAHRSLRLRHLGGHTLFPLVIEGGATWESSKPAVATVDNTGDVTAVGEGHATITAIVPNRRITAEVFVFRYASRLEFTSVTSGDRHACGLTPAGVVYCWGHNDYGQLGNDEPMDRCGRFQTAGGGIIPSSIRLFRCSEVPVRVNSTLRFATVSAGRRQTCALTATGTAYCWGRNVDGATGTGLPDTIVRAPTRVVGGLTFRTIDVGWGQTCGVTSTNSAYCWGDNTLGALGNGSQTDSPVPVAVAGGHTWRTVRAGPTACGLTTDDIAYCWGDNSLGWVGIPTGSQTCGSSSSCSTTPARVAGDLRFTQLESSCDLQFGLVGPSCGLVANGSAYCWGGSVRSSAHVPAVVSGSVPFASLARGGQCGLTADGAVYCWGWLSPSNTAVRSAPEFPVRAITLGGNHRCAIDTNGIVYCWGGSAFGEAAFWAREVQGSPAPPVRVAGQ